jgi:hypothetical protein
MPSLDPILIFTRAFEALKLRYMVSGSVAAIYYGEPRLTNDVDIIVFLTGDEAVRLAQAFPLDEFYCPPLDVIQMEVARAQRGHFNLIHHETGFKADIYTGGRDELHAWGIENTILAKIGDDDLRLAPPEYVIIRKLQFYREGGSSKHLRDILAMVKGLGPDWDRGELDALIASHGLQSAWREALQCDA